MKTASRVLGTAFFKSGFEVQDAPRYGAERRGAPTFAYVRAAREPILERGIIRHPDLVIVGDDTLPAVPASGVMQGIDPHTVMLIHTRETEDVWRQRLNFAGQILVLPATSAVSEDLDMPFVGCISAGAAARLVGVISRQSLAEAVREEIAAFGPVAVEENERRVLWAYDHMSDRAATVLESGRVSARDYQAPDWIEVPFEEARVSAPAIHAAATSVQVKTGAWRTMRPIVDESRCKQCWWICSTFCPDSAIRVTSESRPEIDYDYCKGCMVCVAICPSHAIDPVPETATRTEEHT